MIEQDIMSDVADIYGITISDIKSRRRLRRYADARAVICYMLYSVKSMTLVEIAKMLNRTHASVIYFNRKAEDWLQTPLLNKRGACAIRELERRYKTEDV